MQNLMLAFWCKQAHTQHKVVFTTSKSFCYYPTLFSAAVEVNPAPNHKQYKQCIKHIKTISMDTYNKYKLRDLQFGAELIMAELGAADL